MIPNNVASALARLDDELSPIRQIAERTVGADSAIDPNSRAALISHRPRIGPEAYACVLFPGVEPETIARYEQIQHSIGNDDFQIPAVYKEVLSRLNGASIFRLELYGLPPSMCQTPPLLDRSARQPLDLGTANAHWRTPYRADRAQFHFGSSPYTPEESAGYFLNTDGSVLALVRGGQKIGEWPSMEAFLMAELLRAERTFSEFENRMGEIVTTAKPKRGGKGRQRRV